VKKGNKNGSRRELTIEALEPRLFLDAWPIPLPDLNFPEVPPLQPTVVTAGGQRLLLAYFNNNDTPTDDVTVSYDAGADQLVTNRSGWWVINYPLDQIVGLPADADQVASILFGPGKTAADVDNWYILTPVDAEHPLAAEPAEPTGPAPITLDPNPTFYVDDDAAAGGDGSAEHPFKTINQAIAALPVDGANTVTGKSVIHVMPGTYRGYITEIYKNGTPEHPIIVEGERDADGKMPMISAAEVFADGAWGLTALGSGGIYRAAIPFNYGNRPGDSYSQRMGIAAANDVTFIERSNPNFLDPGEDAFNYGSTEFINMHGMAENDVLDGMPDQSLGGGTWATYSTDGQGYLNFNAISATAADKVFWASTWIYVQPKGDFPDGHIIVNRDNYTYGSFRAAPKVGVPLEKQPNPYRLWVNGDALGKVYNSKDNYEQMQSHPVLWDSPYGPAGSEEQWFFFNLNAGWNHMVFQFDTSVTNDNASNPYYSKGLTYKFAVDTGTWGFGSIYTSATKPADLSVPPTGTPTSYISQFQVLTPFGAATPDRAIYARLSDAQNPAHNPNNVMTEVQARTATILGGGDYNQIRGIESRFAGIGASGQGSLLEGNYILDTDNVSIGTYGSVMASLPYSSDKNTDSISFSYAPAKTGDLVTFDRYSGLSAPLEDYHPYYIGFCSDGKVRLYHFKDDALNDTNRIDLQDNVTGWIWFPTRDSGDAPIIMRNNWLVNGGHESGSSFEPTHFINADNQNGDVPGKLPFIDEYNYIINPNWAGYDYSWNGGGMKNGGMTQGIYRYNVFDGGVTGNLWLDFENWNNIIEGNLFKDVYKAAISMEASQGPNLYANNIISSMNGTMWGATALASWNSHRNWAINNTIDGAGARGGAWDSTIGINMGSAETDPRGMRYQIPGGAYPFDPSQAYVNNLIIGTDVAMYPHSDDINAGNYGDQRGDTSIQYQRYLGLLDRANKDYRLEIGSPLADLGAADVLLYDDGAIQATNDDLVKHDFYGLLRFDSDGHSVGAVRPGKDFTSTTLEVEYADGTMERLENWHSYLARWKLDETSGTSAADASENHHDGALYNGGVWDAGRIAGGLTLDGADDYVNVPSSSQFDVGAGAFSVSAWIKLAADRSLISADDAYPILSRGDAGNGRPGFQLALRGNTGGEVYNGLVLTLYTGAGSIDMVPSSDERGALGDHNWHLVTATRDGSGMGQLYIDGVSVGSAAGFGQSISDGNALDLRIGQDLSAGFKGTLDDVRLYDWALSAGQVQSLAGIPAVSIAATDNEASELGDTGTFTVTRTGSTLLPLIVHYTTGGTATNGVDYRHLSGIVAIPAGASGATITVTPVDSAFSDGETVVVTVTDGDLYDPSGTASATVTLVSANGLVARWKLDETAGIVAADFTGNGHDGAVSGGPTWNTYGYLEGGLTLDGTDDYVNVPSSGQFDVGAGTFSVSAWIKLADDKSLVSAADAYVILNRGSPSNGRPGFRFALRGNTGGSVYNGLVLTLYTGTSSVDVIPGSDQRALLGDHGWHLVTATRDGSGVGQLYIDGVNVASQTGRGQSISDGNALNLQIGQDSSVRFKGTLDDARFYGRALSAAEVQRLASPTLVTLAATDDSASELGDTGTITFTRSGSTDDSLTVHYTISGTAVNGTTYVYLDGLVTIPSGSSAGAVTIEPIDSEIADGTVILTLADDGDGVYDASHPLSSATVAIHRGVDMVAHWKLDETGGTTATDSSGNNHDGALIGNAAWGAGYVDGGMALDGSGDYVNVPSSTQFDIGAGAFTVSAWVKLADDKTIGTANDSFSILSRGNWWNGHPHLWFALRGNTPGNSYNGLVLRIYGGGFGSFDLIPSTDQRGVFNNHQWHQVTATRGADGAGHLYIDGALVGSNDFWEGAISDGSAQDLQIGRYPDVGGFFKGGLDDVRIYGRALSDSEVQALADFSVVGVAATDDQASEAGDTGTFTVTRTGPLDLPMVVNYMVAGTATNGSDYQALTGSVTIPIDSSTATITVTPVSDTQVEGSETVILTLAPGPVYYVSQSGGSGAVTIADGPTDQPPVIAILTDSPDPVIRGEDLTLTAGGVTDANGAVTKVEFYRESNGVAGWQAGDALLGTDANGADGWSLTVSTVGFPVGSQTYYARAQDDGDLWSAAVSAAGLVNQRPEIATLTDSPDPVTQGDPLTLTAGGVADADGSVTKVEFYRESNGVAGWQADDALLGSDVNGADGWSLAASTAGFSLGNQTYYARVRDNIGAWSLPASAAGEVNARPTVATLADAPDPVTLGDDLTLTAGGAADSDGSVVQVVFSRESNGVAGWQADDALLGSDANGLDGWSLVVSTAGFAAGDQAYYARAQDNEGAWSLPASAAGLVNARPAIAALADAPDPVTLGDQLTLAASGVADADGSVAQVEFYRESNGVAGWQADDQGLGALTDGSSGWGLSVSTAGWTAGWQTYFARAQDDRGAWSDIVQATGKVNAAPVVASLDVAPSPVMRGDSLTLTANGVADADGSVSRVEFYRDADGDGALNPAKDTLLGSDTDPLSGWSWVGSTSGWTLGSQSYFARAVDNDGAAGNVVEADGAVDLYLIASRSVGGVTVSVYDIDTSDGISSPVISWASRDSASKVNDVAVRFGKPGYVSSITLSGDGAQTQNLGLVVEGDIKLGKLSDRRTAGAPLGFLASQGDVGSFSLKGGLAGASIDNLVAPGGWALPESDHGGKTGLYSALSLSALSFKGDVSGNIVAGGKIVNLAVTGGQLNGSVISGFSIGKISVKARKDRASGAWIGGSINGDISAAAGLKSLSTFGNLSGNLDITGDLGAASIGGNMINSLTEVSGLFKKMTVKGNFTNSGVEAGGLSTITVKGVISGDPADGLDEIHAQWGTFNIRTASFKAVVTSLHPISIGNVDICVG